MRKFSIVLLSVLLLIVFVGCDLSVETMGKMGNNLAGTDKKYVANIIKQTAPASAEKASDGTINGGSFTISVTDTDATFAINGKEVKIESEALKDIEAIILPSTSSVSEIVQGLKSGNSEAIKKELQNPAEDDSLKAAQGTVLLYNGILDQIVKAIKDAESGESGGSGGSGGSGESGESKEENGFVKVIDEIKGFLPSSDSIITNGDVVVLTALTNIVLNDSILSNLDYLVSGKPGTGSEGTGSEGTGSEGENTSGPMATIMTDLASQLPTLLEVVNNVPSSISDNLNTFITNLMSGNGNKEE